MERNAAKYVGARSLTPETGERDRTQSREQHAFVWPSSRRTFITRSKDTQPVLSSPPPLLPSDSRLTVHPNYLALALPCKCMTYKHCILNFKAPLQRSRKTHLPFVCINRGIASTFMHTRNWLLGSPQAPLLLFSQNSRLFLRCKLLARSYEPLLNRRRWRACYL